MLPGVVSNQYEWTSYGTLSQSTVENDAHILHISKVFHL